MKTEEYTILRGQARIAAADFVQRYVDLKDPAAGCRPCPDYGRFWTCPPYDMAAADYWAGFDTVLLEGMQFHFTPAMLERRFDPEELAEYTRRLTAEQARQMDRALRRQYPGAAVLTTGGCTLCEECTRPMGRPCRHPEAVGYSLESLGCDVGAAARGGTGLGAAVAPAGQAAPISDAAVRRAAVTYKIFESFSKFGLIFQYCMCIMNLYSESPPRLLNRSRTARRSA